MNVNEVISNERSIKLLEEISEKLSYLLSELKKGNRELVDNEIMMEDELDVENELELAVKLLVTQDNCTREHMELCDEYSYVDCCFEL